MEASSSIPETKMSSLTPEGCIPWRGLSGDEIPLILRSKYHCLWIEQIPLTVGILSCNIEVSHNFPSPARKTPVSSLADGGHLDLLVTPDAGYRMQDTYLCEK